MRSTSPTIPIHCADPNARRLVHRTAVVYFVTHFEVEPSACAESGALALTYADQSRTVAGNCRLEVFEDSGRAGRFAVLEAWSDRDASRAHDTSATDSAFRERLQPWLLGIDKRAYKPLSARLFVTI
jgi:quinol monooxygenase YgiN